MADKPPNPTTALVLASMRVWDAYLNYGPVNDATPAGEEFKDALDAMILAIHEVRYDPDSGYQKRHDPRWFPKKQIKK